MYSYTLWIGTWWVSSLNLYLHIRLHFFVWRKNNVLSLLFAWFTEVCEIVSNALVCYLLFHGMSGRSQNFIINLSLFCHIYVWVWQHRGLFLIHKAHVMDYTRFRRTMHTTETVKCACVFIMCCRKSKKKNARFILCLFDILYSVSLFLKATDLVKQGTIVIRTLAYTHANRERYICAQE